MRRSDYLRLRERQQDVSLGVERWDTAGFGDLTTLEGVLSRRLALEEAELEAGPGPRLRPEAELRTRVSQSRDLLVYLRALRYLRQHGIAADWPRGSAAPMSAEG